MELKEVMKELESYADERTKNTLMNHGGREPIFGVKAGDLKKILKKTRKIMNCRWLFMIPEIRMPCILQGSWLMKRKSQKIS